MTFNAAYISCAVQPPAARENHAFQRGGLHKYPARWFVKLTLDTLRSINVIIANYMTPNPLTIAPGAKVEEALNLMRQKNVRHLPVVDNGKIVGVVTDKDIRSTLDPAILSGLTMADLMTKNPVVIPMSTSVQEAARMIFNKKTTGLLITKNDKLVGIITLADMLKVLVEILDLLGDSTRLNLSLKCKDDLEHAYEVIHEHGGSIISVALVPSTQDIYSFRLEGGDIDAMMRKLNQLGYQVERN